MFQAEATAVRGPKEQQGSPCGRSRMSKGRNVADPEVTRNGVE